MKEIKQLIKIYIPAIAGVIIFFYSGCSQERNSPVDQKFDCTASVCHASTMLRDYPPQTGKHSRHLARGYVCNNCHNDYYTKASHRNGINDASAGGNIIYFDSLNPAGTWDDSTGTCSDVACHIGATGSVGWYNTPVNECRACHVEGSSIDPLVTSRNGTAGKHLLHGESSGFACENCHYNYKSRPTHMNGTYGKSETSTIVYFGSDFRGSPVSGAFGDSTGTCSSISCHGYASGFSWYAGDSLSNAVILETKTSGCYSCHSSGSEYDPVTVDSTAGMGRHAKHSGIYCEKCHSGYGTSGTHKNGNFDQGSPAAQLVVFDSTNTGGQWINDTGAGTGSCTSLSCHPSTTLDWYTSAPWVLPTCASCHKSSLGSRRQVFDSNGDGSGTGGDFNRTSHHIINYASRTTQIVQDSDCTTCHDQSKHMSGLIRLKDYNNPGQAVLYDPAAPSSAEAFCLGCHDRDGANGDMTPFSNGNTLGTAPNRAGIEIKSSWEMQNGHRRKGLTCLGNGTPGTGCHGSYNTASGIGSINAHGSGNVGILANKMELPVANSNWDETRYKLCSDCHNNYSNLSNLEKLVRVAPGGNYAQEISPLPYETGFMSTGFHDYRSYNYDRPFNLHLYHLQTSNWSYRGIDSSIQSCITCHNVHGTSGSYFSLWDEWYYTIEIENGIEYGKFGNAGFSATQYPEFCGFTCHWDGSYRYPRKNPNEVYAIANIPTGTLINGNTVILNFSDSTNGISLNESNIDIALEICSTQFNKSNDSNLCTGITHKWIDQDKGGSIGELSVVWSSTNGKVNNVLTINIFSADPSAMNPTIMVGDYIKIAPRKKYSLGLDEFPVNAYQIRDSNGIPYRGSVILKGSN